MRIHTIEVSTEVFHLLQQHAPHFVEWTDEKSGPTQKILLEDDVYTEFIDRAIAHRQTLDQVIRDTCARSQSQPFATTDGTPAKRVNKSN